MAGKTKTPVVVLEDRILDRTGDTGHCRAGKARVGVLEDSEIMCDHKYHTMEEWQEARRRLEACAIPKWDYAVFCPDCGEVQYVKIVGGEHAEDCEINKPQREEESEDAKCETEEGRAPEHPEEEP